MKPVEMQPNEKYVDGLIGKDDQLDRVLEQIRHHHMPEISIKPAYGRLLTMLVQLRGANRVLEIGALGGYSSICLARGLTPGGTVTSLELLPAYAEVARHNVTEAGFGAQIDYIVGDAKASLANLHDAGRSFDFFFIDADKEGYPIYLDWALKLATPGAVIVGDNTLLHGRIANLDKQGPSVQAMRTFNERIIHDDRLLGTMLPGFDGLAIAVVQ